MTPKVSAALADIPVRNLTASLPTGETLRRNPSEPHGAMVEHAMKCARIEVKQLAGAMGISESFLLRGFKDQEHISWQRLLRACAEYPRFKRQLLEVLAEETEGADVTLQIQIRRPA